ncbi:glycosyl hydrolase 115 family protein [Pedobacter sp. SYSU D00535]|uniref:glycosyl hydrolase 115 family protein n=1 Tax=Pedobacter sp. SYSU D00535 TaxID=2810308 RepID=UPI001A9726A7|nr:glycosyl hydrolase 115 family protein [Pedobacter sp. SYSU D00535]
MRIKLTLILSVLFLWNYSSAQPVATKLIGLPQYVEVSPSAKGFEIAKNGNSAPIYVDGNEWAGVVRAANDLSDDIRKVSGTASPVLTGQSPAKGSIIVGTIGKSKLIDQLIRDKKIDVSRVRGQWESYLIQTVGDHLIIAGSDKRGSIFGIYDLSEKIGVSPWYWWADVPVQSNKTLVVKPGKYIQESPKVKYRGIFLNDEAPALTGWVKNSFGTNYGGHKFYGHVFELILRLRANYLWPAMWSWAFYQDDPQNSKLADEMGVVIGTSHHEPMARNHQEWSRKRKEYGAWNYATNQKVLDNFFREGIERVKGTEDLITIGMRGDGDEPMSEDSNVELLETIVKNQRKIIEDVTKKPAKETPQVWALYKEVLDYYEAGMRVPDDVIMLLCDDNWGNVRKLPNEKERKHKGGWGMYYHVDYVGAPRNYKWLNVTPIQNMWEQMQLTYDYGVDKLWIVNVGDLKPMEYPITLFLDMGWDPAKFTAKNLLTHTRQFCAQQFGEAQADEAMRILNLYSKYAGRVTPEMLDRNTYNVETGEWKQVSDEYLKLEAEALRQYMALEPQYRDAYKQVILFPVQAMANLYEMYYAQAMNHKLYADKNPSANFWADKVEQTFKRDSLLTYDYNNVMSGGKWKHMMDQKHIGYTSWNDNFPGNILPTIYRINNPEGVSGKYVFSPEKGYVSIEAEHFYERKNAPDTEWTTIPYMGRTLSGIALMPYAKPVKDASLTYKMTLPKDVRSANVHIVVKSTLAFLDKSGHKYKVGFKGGKEQIINFNADLNEDKENRYSIFYPTVARRVVEKVVKLDVPVTADGTQLLTLSPLDPGIVFEKIVVDFGGYKKSYLFMNESPTKREVN